MTPDEVQAERERVARLVESAMRSLATAIRNGDPAPPKRTTKTTKPVARPTGVGATITPAEQQVVDQVLGLFPHRPEPTPYVAARAVLVAHLRAGVPGADLVDAAARYARSVQRAGTEPQYVRSLVTFYRDGIWEGFRDIVTVFGRTRDEWRQSGQDVAEFDRMAGEITAKEAMAR
jgi:hypothetical protein